MFLILACKFNNLVSCKRTFGLGSSECKLRYDSALSTLEDSLSNDCMKNLPIMTMITNPKWPSKG